MNTLTADLRPAKIERAFSNALARAREHLRTGNPGAYARALAGEHHLISRRQQTALEAVIAFDGQERLFVRHPASGRILAKEC